MQPKLTPFIAGLVLFLTMPSIHAAQPQQQVEDQSDFRKIVIKEGVAFSTAMQNIGVSYKESLAIVEASRSLFNLNNLKPGQVIYYKKSGKAYPILDELRIAVGQKEVRYIAAERKAKLTGKEIIIHSTFIKERVADLKDSNSTRYQQLLDIFSYRIDHDRGFKAKDEFVLLYDDYKDEYGSFVKGGAVRYAAFSSGRKIVSAYLYNGSYYDAHAKPLNHSLFYSPLERDLFVTSGYGWRRHPVRRFRDFHPAVDYRAPHGTPILASADGVIEAYNFDKWLGNHVILKHENGWRTLYGHFSDFAPSIKKGGKVKAGDVIGYAGATGTATGAHLHFAIIRGADPVDPRPFLVKKATNLSLEQESDFFIFKKAIDEELKTQAKAI